MLYTLKAMIHTQKLLFRPCTETQHSKARMLYTLKAMIRSTQKQVPYLAQHRSTRRCCTKGLSRPARAGHCHASTDLTPTSNLFFSTSSHEVVLHWTKNAAKEKRSRG